MKLLGLSIILIAGCVSSPNDSTLGANQAIGIPAAKQLNARFEKPSFWCDPTTTPWRKGSNVCGQMTMVAPLNATCTFEDHVKIDGSGYEGDEQYKGAAGLQMVWWSSDNDNDYRNHERLQYFVYSINVTNTPVAGYGRFLFTTATCGAWKHKYSLNVFSPPPQFY